MRIASTTISMYAHLTALQEERDRRYAEVAEERDRRYAEVAIEREKALKIKDEADRRALTLADEIQKYKDEKANNLRSQIENERGSYATKVDLNSLGKEFQAIVKPLNEFVSRSRGGGAVWGQLAIGLGLLLSAIALFVKL